MKINGQEIFVYADWEGMSSPKRMGTLTAQLLRGKEVFSFEYNKEWLRTEQLQNLDPELKLYAGPQYLSDDKSNFGLFLDSSPDRWGRVLMKRREAIRAREEGRNPRLLWESDFLLGVNDETRMGGLRFKLNEKDDFLANDPEMKAPPFASIRSLEEASLHLEDDNFFEQENALKWLKLLVAPGSSLGGARPKASVRDPQGNLWIAKFPSKSDEIDIGAWEYLTSQLAGNVGLQIPETNAQKFSQKQHTFLSKRFDRGINDQRIHFASAMTLLGYKDGYNHQDGGSYLEIVELIERFGANPRQDLLELWKRMVFSVLVSNTDDHLRNHGFLLTLKGWQLSPAFDVNPNPKGQGLSLNISDVDNSLNKELCLEVATFFRWKHKSAQAYIKEAIQKIRHWRTLAEKLGISRQEQAFMEPAFRYQDD